MSGKRQPSTTMKEAVANMERYLGVKLKRTPEGFYLAELPKNHPIAIKTGNNRLLLKIVPGPLPESL